MWREKGDQGEGGEISANFAHGLCEFPNGATAFC
jgi:hypothetical protein